MSSTTPVLTTERRFDRASWLALAFVVGFAIVCFLVAMLVVIEPGDGCLHDARREDSTIYACVGHWDTPLKPGDRINSVVGLGLEGREYAILQRERDWPIRASETAALPYVVDRAGEQVDLMVPLGRLDAMGIVRAFRAGLILYVSEELWLWLLTGSAVIFALAPRSRAAQLLLIASGSGAAVTTLAWIGTTVAGKLLAPLPLQVSSLLLGSFWQWLLVPTLLLLVLSFPRRVWPLTRWPRAAPLLVYGVPLVALAAALITGQSLFVLATLGLGALGFVAAASVVTVHTIWRGRDPVVRAQTILLAVSLLVGVASQPALWLLVVFVPGLGEALEARQELATLYGLIVVGTFFLCMGIAITRYRLFDIAFVINRALVYTLLTAALAVIYFGGVVLVQGIVRALTGQESDLAIVVSTLAVAACFQPLRGRIQDFIDRRFFRRRYDATLVLAAHGSVVRDEVDIDRLSAGLIRAAHDTLQPAHASLWLRRPEERR